MPSSPSVLLITTQNWLQIARIAMRFIRYGAPLSVICPEESPLTCTAGVAKQFRFQLLRPLASLQRAIAKSGAEYLLPADDLAVFFLRELYERDPSLRPLIERSLGNSRFFPLLHSRPEVLQLAAGLGIRVPETRVVANAAELHDWYTGRSPRAVLKRDGTWGGNGVYLAGTQREAQRAREALARGTGRKERVLRWLRNGDGSAFTRLRSERNAQVTVQEHIDGTPANAMFACHRGRILGGVQARVLASIGSTGPSLIVRILDDVRIRRAGDLLAASLQLSGFFGLDFMLDRRTGEPYLLELNARLTRLGHLGMVGSPDLAGSLWHEWTGEPHAATGEASPGDSVAFFPDGHTLLSGREELEECRADVLDEEREMLVGLIARHTAKQTPLRRQAWLLMARARRRMSEETAVAPHFHTETAETASGPQLLPRKDAAYTDPTARLA